MTSPILPRAVGGEAAEFPVGGRPAEWRALEENSAFEKWFADSSMGPGGTSNPAEPVPGQRTAPRRDQATSVERQLRQSNGDPDAAIVSGDGDAARPVDALPALRPGTAATPGIGLQATGTPPRVVASETKTSGAVVPRSQLPAEGRWTALAVTSLLDDRRVRLWVRDFGLSDREIAGLQGELTQELRRLGYALAQLVVNGRQQPQRNLDMERS